LTVSCENVILNMGCLLVPQIVSLERKDKTSLSIFKVQFSNSFS